jgi:Ribbon-helix-helix protein, copG family
VTIGRDQAQNLDSETQRRRLSVSALVREAIDALFQGESDY